MFKVVSKTGLLTTHCFIIISFFNEKYFFSLHLCISGASFIFCKKTLSLKHLANCGGQFFQANNNNNGSSKKLSQPHSASMSDMLVIGYPGSPAIPAAAEPAAEAGPQAAEVKVRRPPRNVLQCRIELLDGTYYVVQLHVSPDLALYLVLEVGTNHVDPTGLIHTTLRFRICIMAKFSSNIFT